MHNIDKNTHMLSDWSMVFVATRTKVPQLEIHRAIALDINFEISITMTSVNKAVGTNRLFAPTA